LLAQRLSAAQKIECVFSCQSQNLSAGALGACAPSPSRLNGKTWQDTRPRNPPCSPLRSTQRCCYSPVLFEYDKEKQKGNANRATLASAG
jgi:hypothetical protein